MTPNDTLSLTEKQRRFVEAYCGPAEGNATEAARLAGYSGNDATLSVTGCRTLGNVRVASAIVGTRSPRTDAATIDALRRQELLSSFAEDGTLETRDRIRAIEVLGKMQGDFVERREVKSEVGAVVIFIPDNGRDG